MARTSAALLMLPHALVAFAADAAAYMIQGFNGESMTAAEFQAAKQAHRRDPENHEDPRVTLGLGRNIGYDAFNGVRGDWRPRTTNAESDPDVDAEDSASAEGSGLDTVIGYLDDGSKVTARQFRDAQRFHTEHPSAPKPPELRLVGTSYSASISVRDGHREVRFQSQGNRKNRFATFCVMSLPHAVQGERSCLRRTRAPSISRGRVGRNMSTDAGMSAALLLGIALCIAIRFGPPPLRRRRLRRLLYGPRNATSAATSLSTSSVSVSASVPSIQAELDGSVYAGLPSFEGATFKWHQYTSDERRGILSEIREHLESCGLLDVVAVDLKHKHFDVPLGSVLLEEQNLAARESVMRTAKFGEGMVPYSFKYSSGRWLPYEYTGSDCEAAVEGYERVRNLPNFLGTMSKIVQQHGVEDILGFHILHRAHLDGEARGTIETPGRADSELLVRPYTDDLFRQKDSQKTSQVMWCWPGGGGTCYACYCNHCGSHCNGHINK